MKLTFSLMVTFYLTKTENRTKKFQTQLSHYCFEKGPIFAKKRWFLEKNANISKIKKALILKAYFLKLHLCVNLRTKFEDFSIILASFRQGEGNFTPPPPATPQKEPLKSPPSLGLKLNFLIWNECHWSFNLYHGKELRMMEKSWGSVK